MTLEEIERQRRMRRIREQALINRAQSDRGWMGDSSSGGGIYSLPPPAVSDPGPFPITNNILGDGGLDYALYDSSTLDRMWQESTGQTPADLTLPVGLIVGREKQAAKTFAQVMAGQPERVSNGTFTTDLTGWVTPNGGWAWDNGLARLTGDGSVQTFRQDVVFEVGKAYFIEFDVTAVGGVVGFDNQAGQLIGSGASGRVKIFWVADKASLSFKRGGGATAGTLDNISVKQVPAHYASQASAGARPVLQSDGIKFDGSDDNLLTDWFAQAGANCIVSDIIPPATLSSDQFFVGADEGTTARFRLGIQSTTGKLLISLGSLAGRQVAASPDLRGVRALIGLSIDGTTVKAFIDGAEVDSFAQGTDLPTLTIPSRLGARSASGTAANFFGGVIKRTAFGKTAITLAQFQQIRAEWLAAA